MAYEIQTWVKGEIITKEKLDHIEMGIATGDSPLLPDLQDYRLEYIEKLDLNFNTQGQKIFWMNKLFEDMQKKKFDENRPRERS